MNIISTKINAILLATMVATAPVCASENQSIAIVSEQQDATDTQDSVVWYKKCTTKQVVAGLAATAIGLYALAVRKNKVAGPIALFTALFCAKRNIAEATDGKKDDESKEVGNKKADINVDGEKPEIKNAENKQQDLTTIENEKKPEVSLEGDTEGHKPATLTPENQKAVEEKVTPVDPAPAQNQPKNDQPLAVPQNVEKNTQSTNQAPLHIKAQESVLGALNVAKNWLAKGLMSDNLSNN